MRVKICGITTPEDAELVARAGADAIGLNFVAGPRQLTLPAAAEILATVPPFVTTVALVSLQDTGGIPADVLELLGTHRVSHVQLYGSINADAIVRLVRGGFRPLLVGRVRDRAFTDPIGSLLAECGADRPAGIVLDTFDPHKAGGTGQSFHWPWLREAGETGELENWPPIILAGGLRPDNVAAAVAEAGPWGVDVSSGVEAEVGRKSAELVRNFIQGARTGVHA